MVRLHQRTDIPRKLDVGQHLDASGGVAAHELPFRVVELSRFVQDLFRNDKLPDVVK